MLSDFRINIPSTAERRHTNMETRSNMFLQLSLFSLLAFVAADPVPMVNPMNKPTIGEGLSTAWIVVTDEIFAEVPHQVSLRFLGRSYCGGSIISDQWVVTAAQCVSYPPNLITVQAGSVEASGGSLHMVAQIIVHPNYTLNSDRVPISDVAVLMVSPPFKLDTTRYPVPIFKQDEVAVPGTNAKISGWGVTDENGSTPDFLQVVELPIVSKKSCDEAYQQIAHLPEEKICAGVPEGGMGTCQGDEGGPVTIGNRLAGIVSWSYGCAKKGYPAVYTEVAAFSNWIASKTGIEV